jgi:hypothetical protein
MDPEVTAAGETSAAAMAPDCAHFHNPFSPGCPHCTAPPQPARADAV